MVELARFMRQDHDVISEWAERVIGFRNEGAPGPNRDRIGSFVSLVGSVKPEDATPAGRVECSHEVGLDYGYLGAENVLMCRTENLQEDACDRIDVHDREVAASARRTAPEQAGPVAIVPKQHLHVMYARERRSAQQRVPVGVLNTSKRCTKAGVVVLTIIRSETATAGIWVFGKNGSFRQQL